MPGPPRRQPAQELRDVPLPSRVRQHHLLDQQPLRHGALLLGAHWRANLGERYLFRSRRHQHM